MRGDRLRHIREESGFTQDELAEILGVGVLQINRYENEKTVPNGDMVAAIAKALHISSDYLLGLTDDPKPVSADGLSSKEWVILSALRAGQSVKAIKLIVEDE